MSAPSIEFEISDEAQALMRRIEDRPGMMRAIARTMDVQNHLTIAHISSARMRGNNNKPFPVSEHKLGIRSALLSKSIRATKSTVQGDTVTSSIGSNVKYAGIHEFGGTIKRVLLAGSVRLATDRQGNLLRRGKNGKLAVFARKSRKTATTVAYSGGKRFEVTIPARAPFRHGIADRQKEIGAAVSQSVIEFWKKSKGGGK